MNQQLPSAVTTEQLYMAAILEELRALRSALAPATESVTTTDVPLREPEKRRPGRPRKNRQAGA